MPTPAIATFYEPRTASLQYVVADPATRQCAIIDPVLDFDEKSGATATRSANAILAHLRHENLTAAWILDTHPHADHFSAAAYLRSVTGAPTAIGARITGVQSLWKSLYNLEGFPTDGSQWDRLLADGDTLPIGALTLETLFTPGHTLCSVTYRIADAAFVNDTLFAPDSGTARTDFPGGDPAQLWRSIQRILALPDATRLFTGHDYRPNGRPIRPESTVAEQRAANTHLLQARAEADFIQLRTTRDRTLPMPKLILHALQVNIAAGRLPPLETNGRRYLKLPLDALGTPPWD